MLLVNLDWLSISARKTFSHKKRSQGGRTKYTPAFTLDDFLQGRQNFEAYSHFLTYFGPCLGKKTDWRDNVMGATKDNDILSRSTEAFGLLLLENQWDRWFDFYCMNDGRITSKRGQKRAKTDSRIKPKYTKGGITFNWCKDKEAVKEDDDEAKKGWTNAGIHRFNELYDFVKNDRKKNKGFIQKWLIEERKKFSEKKRKRTPTESAPTAKHDLFSDNEEEMIQSPVSSSVVAAQYMVTPALGEEKERGIETDQEKYLATC